MSKETNVNYCELTGTICSLPIDAFTPNGKRVFKFRIEVVEGKSKNYFNIVSWGDDAERMIVSDPKKGDEIFISGRQTVRMYKDKDGKNCYFHEVVCNQFKILAKYEPKQTSFVAAAHEASTNKYTKAVGTQFTTEDDIPF